MPTPRDAIGSDQCFHIYSAVCVSVVVFGLSAAFVNGGSIGARWRGYIASGVVSYMCLWCACYLLFDLLCTVC